MSKRIDVLFCASFIAMIVLPLVLLSTDPGGNTKYESRALAKWPNFHDEKGEFNSTFLSGFENWFSDHIGFRDSIMRRNALLQYYLFKSIKMTYQTSNYCIVSGPAGELAGIPIMEDYQHRNLFTEGELQEFNTSMTVIRDYLASRGCHFYYMQCYDKHSIYPEQYPKSIIQYGDISKADQLVNSIRENTDINVVQIKDSLIHAKDSYEVYGRWTEPWHWNPRGAFIAYGELMKAIDRDYPGKYRILCENDFSIEMQDMGMTYFGTIHREEMSESFTVRNPRAVRAIERVTPETQFMFENPYVASFNDLYINESAGNDDTLLILGDSYMHNYIIFQALLESFHRIVIFNPVFLMDDRLVKLVEAYNPKIVVFEIAERQISYMHNLNSTAHVIEETKK